MTDLQEAIIESVIGAGWLIAHLAAFVCLVGGAWLIVRMVLQ